MSLTAGGESSRNPAEQRAIVPGTGPALSGGVTHRIDVRNEGETVLFEFHGLLDAEAMASIDAAVAFARTRGGAVRIVLRAGTEVERALLPGLRALDATVVAESPYLARWIAR
jgi:hypothetical protein